MATYGTDLILLAAGSDAEGGGSWNELIGYTGGGNASSDTENYIQGSSSFSQTMGNSTAVGKSIAFDAGSSLTFGTNHVVMAWVFFIAGSNLYDYATTGGHRFAIAADNVGVPSVNMDMWFISGDDRPPNPEGGWWNVAIDPTVTPDATTGSGNGGSLWHFGSALQGLRAKIAKGTPHGVDVMRYGRGEIYCTGTGATFTLMAAQNDLNANKWGLLKDTGGGTFSWKGLMSLGQVGTSSEFLASNQTIVIDDTAKVSLPFNRIEIRHASTSVVWNNISITSKGTVSPGQFEMIENATVALNGCTFNNMHSFTFLSNATVLGGAWNTCDLITQGGATITAADINKPAGTVGMLSSVSTIALVTDCEFTSDATGHAVDLGNISSTIGITWSNKLNSVVAEWSGSIGTTVGVSGTANDAILVDVDSGITLTINVADGATTPSVQNVGLGTVTIVAGLRTYSFSVFDQAGAQVTAYEWRLYEKSPTEGTIGTVELDGEEVSTQYNQSYPYAYASDQDSALQIIKQGYKEILIYDVLEDSNKNLTITLITETNT